MEDSKGRSIIILGLTVVLFGMLLVVGLFLQKQVWLGINPYIFIGGALLYIYGIFGGNKTFHQAVRIISLVLMVGSMIYMVVCCVIYPENPKKAVYVASCEFLSERQYGLSDKKKEYTFNVTSKDGQVVLLATRDSQLYINLLTKCQEKRATDAVQYEIVYQPYKNDNKILEIKEIMQ